MKIYWLSRHDLSPAQTRAVRDLHGEDAVVVKDAVVFADADALAEYIRGHEDGFVYAVAGAPHYIAAALGYCRSGCSRTTRRGGRTGASASPPCTTWGTARRRRSG